MGRPKKKVDETEKSVQKAEAQARTTAMDEELKLASDDGPEELPVDDDKQAEDSDRELTKEKFPDDQEAAQAASVVVAR